MAARTAEIRMSKDGPRPVVELTVPSAPSWPIR